MKNIRRWRELKKAPAHPASQLGVPQGGDKHQRAQVLTLLIPHLTAPAKQTKRLRPIQIHTNKIQTPKAPKSKSPCPPLRIIPLMTTPHFHLAFGLEIVGQNMSSSDQYSFVQIWSSQITGLSFKKLSN